MQEIILYNGEAEEMELRRLAYKVDARRNQAAREAAEQRAQRAEQAAAKLRAEYAKAQKERQELAAFVSVIALALVALIGVTAAFHEQIGWPVGLIVAGGVGIGIILIMRKVGWLKNG